MLVQPVPALSVSKIRTCVGHRRQVQDQCSPSPAYSPLPIQPGISVRILETGIIWVWRAGLEAAAVQD